MPGCRRVAISALLSKRFIRSPAELGTVVLRVAAGVAGALPPIIALAILDRAAYGHAMANLALALLLLGPIDQFLIHGYLRSLLARGSGTGGPRPDGADCVPIYVLIWLALLPLLGPLVGLRSADLAQIAALIVILPICRAQERWFISIGQPLKAITLFYLAPPLTLSLLILAAQFWLRVDDFVLIALSTVLSYGGCALFFSFFQGRDGLRLLAPRIPLSVERWRREISAAGQFILSGALLAAIEQLPIVLLRLFGFSATIPGFEVARKIASVPGVIVQALNIQLGTELIRQAHEDDLHRFRHNLTRFRRLTIALGLFYFPVASGCLFIATSFFPGLAERIDLPVALIVLGAATVSTLTATAGTVLIALRGDAWWTAAASVSLLVLIAIAIGAVAAVGPLAVPIAVLGETLAFNAVMIYGALLMYRSKTWPTSGEARASTFSATAPTALKYDK